MNRVIVTAVIAIVLSAAMSAQAQNTVTFDNQSGDRALVKLIGPSSKEVEVPNGAKQSVEASAGSYTIKIRYGTPGRYRYTKGQEFEVKETSTTRSEIRITLHKVISGNYDSQPISAEEFSANQPPPSPNRVALAVASPAASPPVQPSQAPSQTPSLHSEGVKELSWGWGRRESKPGQHSG